MSSIDPQRILAAIQVVHDRFVSDRNDTARGEVLAAALRGVLELTDSGIGFIARIRTISTGSVLSPECVLAIDTERHAKVVTWLQDTLALGARGETIPRPLANLARTTEPLLLDYEPRLPALDNLMAIPLSRHGRRWQPVAILAVANRSGGFNPDMVAPLEPLLSACGTVLKAYEDADERAAREAELERSEQRFRTFMDASPCIAYITDPERRVVWASRAFAQQFQIEVSDAIGRSEDDLLPGGMAARTGVIHEQARVADGFVDMLEPIVDANGAVHWWQGAKFPIDGAAGERLVGSLALDVSDNVRMTETLREREAALAESQELARLGRWNWVLETNKLTWDSQFERLCGRPSGDAMGIEDLLDLLHPDDIGPTRRALDKLIDDEARLNLEHRLLVAGEIRELFVVARVRRELEEGAVVLGVAQDVSDRRKLERSRRELDSKARKFESLSVLTGGMAHEFSSLLVGILGNAGIALDDMDHDSLAAVCVQDIEAAAERASELTQQMLAFSGRDHLVPEEFELSSLITDFAEVLHAAISESVSIRLSLHPDLPEIEADRTQIRQLIMNLVVNGSEAIGAAAGELTLSTGFEEFGADALAALVERPEFGPGPYVWLELRDTGSGMDQATQARIFEPFFSTKLAGRGLGLPAVRGIVRSHGGGILVESAPGAGARFRVLLPPARAAGATESSERWSRNAT
ncbi:sensory box histidine kinase/response regulator [Enhygromyxa salina]|uniref:histidine kinase n=1 Tax=Enhygromyxa salina TaxID=215803 RepID=A0A0C2CXX7_9BACT|nr:ATP-binding protein [Enhygromyxa salina]KIG12682.1 sensory box histidine kinase/response regulator [Enhygromyxa salina]